MTNFIVSPSVIQTQYLSIGTSEVTTPVCDCGTLNPIALIFPSNTVAETWGLVDNTIPSRGIGAEYSAEQCDATGTPVAFAVGPNKKVDIDKSIAMTINRFQLTSPGGQTETVEITVVMAPLLQGNI